MWPILAALALIAAVALSSKKSGAATTGFTPISIPVANDQATDAERAKLKTLDRVVIFVELPDHQKLAVNVVIDKADGTRLTGRYLSVFAKGKSWLDTKPIPVIGETFAFPASYVYYVYDPVGELITVT